MISSYLHMLEVWVMFYFPNFDSILFFAVVYITFLLWSKKEK